MTVRRRLVRSTAGIALAAILVLGVPLGIVETARVGTDQSYRLEREADVVAGVLDDRIEAGLPITAAELEPHVLPGHRVSVTDHGKTIFAGDTLSGAIRTVRSSSSRNAIVAMSAPRSEESARVLRAWGLIVLLGIGGVAVAVGLAEVQARRISRPLESLAKSSEQLGAGDFSTRAARSGVPEVDAIAEALDHSAERIARLIAREREFSANASHQLRTPLTALRLRLEGLAQLDDPADRDEELAAALHEADRLEQTIVALLAHAREERSGRAVRLDLARIVTEHARSWARVLARANRSIRVDAVSVEAITSRGTVGQVLDVLLENAARHGTGAVTVRVAADGDRALVSVEDSGPGIPPEQREEVFQRGASPRGGTGIGLHLARALAEADGASLRLSKVYPARFELRVPRAPAAPASPAQAATAGA